MEACLHPDPRPRPGRGRRGVPQADSDVRGVGAGASQQQRRCGGHVRRPATSCADKGNARPRTPAVVNRVLDAVPQAGLDQEEFLKDSRSRPRSAATSSRLRREFEPRPREAACDRIRAGVHRLPERLDNDAAANSPSKVRQQIDQLEADGEGPGDPTTTHSSAGNRLAAATAAQSSSAQVVQSADEAPKVGPRTVRNTLIAFCLGLVLALIVVFLVDALDTRVKSIDTIRDALGLRLLGRLATPPKRRESATRS